MKFNFSAEAFSDERVNQRKYKCHDVAAIFGGFWKNNKEIKSNKNRVVIPLPPMRKWLRSSKPSELDARTILSQRAKALEQNVSHFQNQRNAIIEEFNLFHLVLKENEFG